MKPNIAIITSGYLPLPPVKGGAVENLVQLLADENEQKNKLDLTIFSIYDKNAKDESVNYKNTHYVFIKIPVIIQYLDCCLDCEGWASPRCRTASPALTSSHHYACP